MPEAIAQSFGRNLRAARRRVGISQEEAAIRATLHRTEIGLLGRGERTPRIDTVVKLAGALDITADALLAGMDWTAGSAERGSFVLSAPTEGRGVADA